jgi:thiol:disulfide interchange protein
MARTDQRVVPVVLFIVAVALIAGRVAVHFTKKAPAANRSAVRWLTPAEGMRLAETSNKPVLFDFTAEWCRPCHMLEAEVFSNAAIAHEINERFIPIRVTDRQQEEGRNSPEVDALQQRFAVNGFPTVVFADTTGTERGRMEGFRGREEFERVMESIR